MAQPCAIRLRRVKCALWARCGQDGFSVLFICHKKGQLACPHHNPSAGWISHAESVFHLPTGKFHIATWEQYFTENRRFSHHQIPILRVDDLENLFLLPGLGVEVDDVEILPQQALALIAQHLLL